MNAYRTNARGAFIVGDLVEFLGADGFHLPYGCHRVQSVRGDGAVKVEGYWLHPACVRLATACSTCGSSLIRSTDST